MQTKKPAYDYDYEKGTPRPTAWRKTKELLGGPGHKLGLLFRRLEKIANGYTAQIPLAVALHAYASMTTEARARATVAYFEWCGMIDGHAAAFHKTPPRPAPAAESLDATPPGHTLKQDYGHFQMWECGEEERSPAFGCYFFTCSHCGRKYLDPSALSRHLLKQHGVNLSTSPGQPPAQHDEDDEDDDEGEDWKQLAA